MLAPDFNELIVSNYPREQNQLDPFLAEYIYFERYCREDTQAYSQFSHYNELPAQYQPNSSQLSFSLPLFSIPKPDLRIFLANPTQNLLQLYIHTNSVSFAIHPANFANGKQIFGEYLPDYANSTIKVIPTASSRTVIVVNPTLPFHALKCHCPFRISRFYRNLSPGTIEQSITISRILDRTLIPHLPETIGISLRTKQVPFGCGFIVREMMPRPVKPERGLLIPCFALYGRDRFNPENPPLIVKMLQQTRQDPKDFVLNYIMFPIIQDFLSLYVNEGILLEPHGQNTLLEVDKNLMPIRLIHRDFDAFVDLNLRRELGLATQGFKTASQYNIYPRHALLSLIYDYSIGHHHFDYLTNILFRYFNIPKVEFQIACQNKFAALLPNYSLYFSPKVYYYNNIAVGYNHYALVETGELPLWRPG